MCLALPTTEMPSFYATSSSMLLFLFRHVFFLVDSHCIKESDIYLPRFIFLFGFGHAGCQIIQLMSLHSPSVYFYLINNGLMLETHREP